MSRASPWSLVFGFVSALTIGVGCGGSGGGSTHGTNGLQVGGSLDASASSSGNISPSTACTPGASVSCACTNGDQGAQVCAADGSAYGACVCQQGSASGSSSGSSGGSGSSGSGNSGGNADDASAEGGPADGGPTAGPCTGGPYKGTFGGVYTSHLTGIGIPIPITGQVNMTLDQEGSAEMTCMLMGEATKCSDLFSVQDGTITGVANETGDAGVGGFPFFCTMSGTLECQEKRLVNGWLQCTYCVGPVADGGTACSLAGVGGHFAGPLTANYDYTSLALVMGTWNGAEALAGNDGGSPTPDGGPISNYLSDSGVYSGPNDFGGSGTWNAAHQ